MYSKHYACKIILTIASLILFSCSNDYNNAENFIKAGDLINARSILSKISETSKQFNKAKDLSKRIDFIEDSINSFNDSLSLTNANSKFIQNQYEAALNCLSKINNSYKNPSQYKSSIDSLRIILNEKIQKEKEKEQLVIAENERKKHLAEINAYCKEIQEYKQALRKLYSQLNSFKNTRDFKYYGFATNGNYNVWLKNVEGLNDEMLSLVRQNYNKYNTLYMAFSRLQQLGLEYLSSYSKESTIKWMKDDINAGLAFNCQK